MRETDRGAWHLGMRAAVLAVLFVCGLRGALIETGQSDLIEFILGALTGGAVLWVGHRLLRGLVGTLRGMPADGITLALAVLTTLLIFDQWSMADSGASCAPERVEQQVGAADRALGLGDRRAGARGCVAHRGCSALARGCPCPRVRARGLAPVRARARRGRDASASCSRS